MIRSVSGSTDALGNASVTLSGDNLGLDTRVLFDGAAATSIQKNDDGTFTARRAAGHRGPCRRAGRAGRRRADLRPDHGLIASADVHLRITGSSVSFDHSRHCHRRHRHHDRSRRIQHEFRGRPDRDRIRIERRRRAANLDDRPRQGAAEHLHKPRRDAGLRRGDRGHRSADGYSECRACRSSRPRPSRSASVYPSSIWPPACRACPPEAPRSSPLPVCPRICPAGRSRWPA